MGAAAMVLLGFMKILMAAVFAGWLMMWVVLPTKTYSKTWSPELRSVAGSSTYFGKQGTNLLIFTFPILFVSVLGCVYLHMISVSATDPHNLRKRSTSSGGEAATSRWRHLLPGGGGVASWWKKRPVVVTKGPLGIVSVVELAFGFMFLALLVWSYATYLSNSFKKITRTSAEEDGLKLWQARLDTAANRLGKTGNIGLAFLFFPVTRMSSLLPLIGLTSESSIKYHKWLGNLVMLLFTTHGLCYITLWASSHSLSEMLKWDNVGVANVSGELALLVGLAMWATSFSSVRRRAFEVFYYTHQLYVLFVLFFVLHIGISFACMALPGIYLFILDRFLRLLRSRRNARLLFARLFPCEYIELNFSKSPRLSYNPLGMVFLHIPSISSLQWHPFSVTSSSRLHTAALTVVIKKEGKWTQQLYNKLSAAVSSTNNNGDPLDRLDVYVEGPYSPVSMDFLRYDSLVLVSGGSGITPFISIIRELMQSCINTTTTGISAAELDLPSANKGPKILLICSFKTSAELSVLDLIFPMSSSHDKNGVASLFRCLDMRIEAFVTREMAPDTIMHDEDDDRHLKTTIQTLRFKPLPSDQPLSPVLGSNSWLCLGAVIAFSFVLYLILLGLLMRYYVYPIDHNTNSVYSSAAESLLNMLFICFCVAAVAGAAVASNKKRSMEVRRQIQSTDTAGTPSSSQTPTVYDNADLGHVELESGNTRHHRESILTLASTNVQFGGRANLKEMLLKCKDQNTGVMASGPAGLRHEVASICRSCPSQNLQFESISFNW